MASAPMIWNPCHATYISHPIPDVPVCSSVEPVVYGVGKGEMVDVFCDVVSNPQSYNFEV